jgi:uncharacterized membrane protein (UPF0127 family)
MKISRVVKIWLYFALIFLPVGQICSSPSVPLHFEVAVSPTQRAKGLMGRSHLPPNHGMLFIFDHPHPVSIWMYQTFIDLSVAFLDNAMIIREIHELKAYPSIRDPQFFHDRGVTANFNASYVLEMNRGWFVKHGIDPGDQLVWDGRSSSAVIMKKN